MEHTHIPEINWRYWTLISIASVFGANTGDYISEVLNLGNIAGLPVLAAALFAVFMLEKFDKLYHQTYYWLAIIIIRTAATNIGDLAQDSLGIPKPAMIMILALALVAVVFIGRSLSETLSTYTRQADGNAYPSADARYWTAMLIAGTLGTVVGDYMSYGGAHIGNVYASLILTPILAALLFTGRRGLLVFIPYYWLTVVAVRSAGTAVGDMLAGRGEYSFGLTAGTALSALVFVIVLLTWKNSPTQEALAD